MDDVAPTPRAGDVAARVFAPEAHMPRSRRLVIGPTEVVLEVGVGIQHRFAWADCDAILRFPDRLELVFGQSSVLLRSSEWFRGDEALKLADQLMPSELRIEVIGELEPDIVPYRLDGLARTSFVVLAVAAVSSCAVAVMALTLSAPSRRPVGVLIGLLFLIPIRPLVVAMRRRLSVPRRWRQAAAQASSTRVSLDDLLASVSISRLAIARALLPLVGVAAAIGWWIWTGSISIIFVLLTTALAGVVNLEMRRRHKR